MEVKTQISEWYAGRSVLVTGGTGFMGKVLVEKLLRSCPDLEKIYILIRVKKGVQPEERIEKEIINTELFDDIRHSKPHLLDKIIPIRGDILQPELGLSKNDKEALINNITIVFHSAATVKFDEALKLSVAMNIAGTGTLLKLCQKMKQLYAFVHVSTAYCNCNLTEIEEKFYEPPTDLDALLNLIDNNTDEVLEALTEKIISDRPNTYTFTKAMAEQLLLNHTPVIPMAIVRPSIVACSAKEPFPGWVDNWNGPTGMMVGAGKGVIRTVWSYRNKIVDLIPVDVAINLMICVGWYTATKKTTGIQIYNCASGMSNPLTWGEMEVLGKKAMLSNPFSDAFWYPGGSFKSSRIFNELCQFTFLTIPAYMVDLICLIIGKKRIMVRIKKKITKTLKTMEYFTTREWRFYPTNTHKIWDEIPDDDKQIFNFDVRNLDWDEYINNYQLGVRRYILKEKDETLPEAREQLKKKKIIHYTVQTLLIAVIYSVFIRNTIFDIFSIFELF